MHEISRVYRLGLGSYNVISSDIEWSPPVFLESVGVAMPSLWEKACDAPSMLCRPPAHSSDSSRDGPQGAKIEGSYPPPSTILILAVLTP